MNDGIVIDNVFVGTGLPTIEKLRNISMNYLEPRMAAERAYLEAKAAAESKGVQYTFTEILRLAQENPILAALAGVGALMPILLICFMCTGSSSSSAKPKKATEPKKEAQTLTDKKDEGETKTAETTTSTTTTTTTTTTDADGARKRKVKKAD